MKRSTAVRLTLMTAATATALGACSDASPPPAPKVFATVQECVAKGETAANCQTAFDAAKKAHEEKAPRFSTRDECLKGVDVNDCTEQQVRRPDGSTGSVFLPALAGYALGSLMNRGPGYGGGGYGGGPVYRSREFPQSYRDPGSLATSRTGGSVPSIGGRNDVSTIGRPANVNTTTISRSGFGSSSSSYGSGVS